MPRDKTTAVDQTTLRRKKKLNKILRSKQPSVSFFGGWGWWGDGGGAQPSQSWSLNQFSEEQTHLMRWDDGWFICLGALQDGPVLISQPVTFSRCSLQCGWGSWPLRWQPVIDYVLNANAAYVGRTAMQSLALTHTHTHAHARNGLAEGLHFNLKLIWEATTLIREHTMLARASGWRKVLEYIYVCVCVVCTSEGWWNQQGNLDGVMINQLYYRCGSVWACGQSLCTHGPSAEGRRHTHDPDNKAGPRTHERTTHTHTLEATVYPGANT